MRDILGGIQYLPCPPPPAPLAARSAWTSTTNGTFHVEIPHPNVTLGLGSLWLLLAFLSIYTAVNYQSVVILNRRNAHPSLGNAWWAAYFALMSSSFLLDFLRYAMDLPESSTPSSSLSGNNFLLAACAIRRVSVAVLAASLSYHLQHRVQQGTLIHF